MLRIRKINLSRFLSSEGIKALNKLIKSEGLIDEIRKDIAKLWNSLKKIDRKQKYNINGRKEKQKSNNHGNT